MNKVAGFLCLGLSVLYAAGVEWRNWEAGLKEARESGKMVMIDAVRDGCHYCDDMERAVFKDAKTAAYIEQCFVPVKVNLSHETMPLDLSVPMTPSFYFIAEGAKLSKMIPGSWNREDFQSFLDGMTQCRPVSKE